MLFGSRRHSNRVRIHNVLVDLYRNSSLLILSSTFYVCLLSFVVNSTQLNSMVFFFFVEFAGVCCRSERVCVCVYVCIACDHCLLIVSVMSSHSLAAPTRTRTQRSLVCSINECNAFNSVHFRPLLQLFVLQMSFCCCCC